jgi:hypothetical protein
LRKKPVEIVVHRFAAIVGTAFWFLAFFFVVLWVDIGIKPF